MDGLLDIPLFCIEKSQGFTHNFLFVEVAPVGSVARVEEGCFGSGYLGLLPDELLNDGLL